MEFLAKFSNSILHLTATQMKMDHRIPFSLIIFESDKRIEKQNFGQC